MASVHMHNPMKKEKLKMKKLIAMLLALSMVLAFAGCAKTETAPETTAAPVETAAPEDTAPAAAEEGVLDGVDKAVAHTTREERCVQLGRETSPVTQDLRLCEREDCDDDDGCVEHHQQ